MNPFFHFHSCVHLGPSSSPSLHIRNKGHAQFQAWGVISLKTITSSIWQSISEKPTLNSKKSIIGQLILLLFQSTVRKESAIQTLNNLYVHYLSE